MEEVKKSIIKKIYEKRPSGAKKYDYGLLLVIGGSRFYSGAPALSALAAFKAGVDMVRIIAPERAANIIASFSPNLASYPLKGDWLDESHLSLLIEMTESAKASANGKAAVVIGGGMGRSEKTQDAILKYLSKISIPAVIDADGIYALGKNPSIAAKKPFLVTPHSYEFFILTGKDISRLSLKDKLNAVLEEADRLKTTILLKGEVDIISDGREVAVSKTGSPKMAVGGTGDVLAGIAGALLARGVSPFEVGKASAFINGAAGEIAVEELGESMTATDLLEAISKFISNKL